MKGAVQQATQATPVTQPMTFPVLDIDDFLALFQKSETKPWSALHGQVVSPNNRMQRGGRDRVSHNIFMRARVREALCPRADARRWAT
jgi:hypothetical protein